MVSFPGCKINLGLHVIRKRPDGYHDLETCFYLVPWQDILEIIPAETMAFTSSGISIPGAEADNLCLRAYQLLKTDFNLPPVHIHLHKILPMGAGLGGGSSDGAHTLRILNTVFSLNLSTDVLAGYAAHLGSDCAFFIYETPQLGTGRGEILEPVTVTLKDKYLLLVKPDIHVSTAEAYSGVTPRQPDYDLRQVLENQPVEAWKDIVRNDFEASVFAKYPVIERVKQTLYDAGALYAAMSGSGAAVFGIFSEPVKLDLPYVMWWSPRLK
jgi:4-diphosphocytidyl-2-C-methyl-D-erythritol kinase